MLRTAAAWTLLGGSVAVGGCYLLRDGAAAASCAAGIVFVAALFASGMVALRLLLRGAAHLVQAGAFAVFFLHMYVGLVVAAVGRGAAWVDSTALAAGAIGATLVWQAGMVSGFATARRLVYSPDDGAGRGHARTREGGRR